MEKTYALIKDSIVVNTIIIEEENADMINIIKEINENPEIVEVHLDKNVEVGYIYDGENFIDPNYTESSDTGESSDAPIDSLDLDGIVKPNNI